MVEKDRSTLDLRQLWPDALSSVQFLSRLPVTGLLSAETPDFARSSYTFPLAGLIIAIPAGFCLVVAAVLGISSIIAAVLAALVMIVVTGGLHEDGLADVADGFWGGHTKERKLEIMRDSAIGSYGTLALVIAIFLRVLLVSSLMAQLGGIDAACLLIAMAGLSRLFILAPWIALEPARGSAVTKSKSAKLKKDGESLSVRYGEPMRSVGVRAGLLSLPAILLVIWLAGPIPFAVSAVFGSATIYFVCRLAKSHIGGHTGDVLGATQQISELGLYLGLVIAI